MEFLLRVLQFLMKIAYQLYLPLLKYIRPRKYDSRRIPPIKNPLLTFSLHEVLERLKRRELTSKELVECYIERIREVNPYLNAIVQDRYREAVVDAVFADKIIASTPDDELLNLYEKKPLFGVPCTIKEACGVQGMNQVVGSVKRLNELTQTDGEAVALLRKAGAIPLLTSANPEYCFSIETFSYTNGRCLNPYDSELTTGGSSGGEGALNGGGASLFGIGSDIAGSIRLPSLFNGVFGHKPTGALTSTNGHFPCSDNTDCRNMLQIGPITRFAADLPLILSVISGKNSALLKLDEEVDLKRIKIYYSFGFTGFNALLRQPVEPEIKDAINRAVLFFEKIGLQTQLIEFEGFKDAFEIALSSIARLENFPFILNTSSRWKFLEVLGELLRSIVTKSDYTKESLLFELSRRANAFMSKENLEKYKNKAKLLENEISNILGDDGVLFFPTFPMSAFPHNTSMMTIWSVDYTLLFNVLKLPATHVPMGLSRQGLPVGFQVVATPYNDKLCLRIAQELDSQFGGWVPPSENKF